MKVPIDLPNSATVMRHKRTPWNSATFSGHRHELHVQFRTVNSGAEFVDNITDPAVQVTEIDAQIALDHMDVVLTVVTLNSETVDAD